MGKNKQDMPATSPINNRRKSMCKHSFIIPEATGEYSEGVCKYCGLKKRFRNWTEYDERIGSSYIYRPDPLLPYRERLKIAKEEEEWET